MEERRAFKKLWEEFQLKWKTDSGKVQYIKNNKIVSVESDSG